MSKNFTIKIENKPDVTDLAGEKVMIDFSSGKYFILVGSANDIWSMLEDGITSEEIILKLINVYEVGEDACRAEVLKFLNTLSEIGFISLNG